MGAESINFWGTAFIPAIGAYLLNLAVRGSAAMRTAGADWLLIWFAFDATATMISKDLIAVVPNTIVKNSLPQVVLVSLFLTLISWFLIVKYLEPWLQTPASGWGKVKQIAWYLSAWLFTVLVTAAHIGVFFLKG